MNTPARLGAVAGAAALLVLSASPAMAASVDKSSFEKQLTTAVKQATPAGRAIAVTQKMTVNGGAKPLTFTASRTTNPNGTSIAKSTFLGSSETRCLSKTTCYTSTNKGKTWTPVKDGKGDTQVDDTLTYWSFMQPSAAATFDVSGSTFTMEDAGKKWTTVISGTTVTTTVNLSDPKSSQTGVMSITQKVVKPVKVATPDLPKAPPEGSVVVNKPNPLPKR